MLGSFLDAPKRKARKTKSSTDRKESSGGYPLELFVDLPPNELICPICLEVLEQPYQCSQGHTFCEKCINKCKQSSSSVSSNNSSTNSGDVPVWIMPVVHDHPHYRSSYTCPTCRITFDKLQINLIVRNLINNLQVHCSNETGPFY